MSDYELPKEEWFDVDGNGRMFRVFAFPVETSTLPFHKGVYIYAKHPVGSKSIPVFIGEGAFHDEVHHDHPKYQCAVNNGATHLHIREYVPGKDRTSVVTALLGHYPECYSAQGCNDQDKDQ
jgi:hypothetical protein